VTHGHLLTGSDAIPYHVGHGEGAVRMTRRAGTVAVDIETQGLGEDAQHIVSVQVGTPDEAYVMSPEFDAAAITDCLAAADRLVFHNSPFDVPILVANRLMMHRDIPKVWDTLIGSRMAAPSEIGGHGLGAAYDRHCTQPAGNKAELHRVWREMTGRSKGDMFHELGPASELFCQYAANDAVMTARLAEVLPVAMRVHTADHPFPTSGDADYLLEREQTINRMTLARSCTGITIDLDVIDDLTVELNKAAWAADQVLGGYGIDVSASPVKVKDAVMDRLLEIGAIPPTYRRLQNGRPSADNRERQHLDHPMLDALETRSKNLRWSNDYLDKVLQMSARDGRIHPQMKMAAAVTGRMSIADPPLQQYPAGVRRMMRFDTPAVSMDWSSIEPALFANLAGETVLVEAYESGGDLYAPVAAAAGVSRPIAKRILLAQLYGQGARKLGWSLGLGEEEAKALVELVMRPMHEIRRAKRMITSIGDRYGKSQTISGRVCPLALDPRTGNQRYMGYLAVNYCVQGGAYDLLAEAIYEMHRRGLDDALYVAVHDELVVAADAADEVEQIMRTPPAALVEQAGRVPVLRVGRSELGCHWTPKE
jgi:DNA polymerase-1